eukprot:scaffold121036_cov57-Phaeocystis_antarctica.AAC.3
MRATHLELKGRGVPGVGDVAAHQRDHLPAVVGVLGEALVRHEAVLRVALLTLDDGLIRVRGQGWGWGWG